MTRQQIRFTLLIILFSFTSIYASQPDTTDIKDTIIKSMSRNIYEYLGYQSTTVEMYRNYSTSRSTSNHPEQHLLGGSDYSHDIIVNGLSFRNPLTGVCDISFSNALFDNLHVYSLNIPVRFSNVNSAVIDLNSPEISQKFQATLESFSDNFVGNKFEQYYYRGELSGSLTNSNKLKFWTAFESRSLGDRMPSSLTSDVLSGSPDMLPYNDLSGLTYHGKLQFDISNSSTLKLTIDGSSDKWQEYIHYYNNPVYTDQIEHTPRYKDETYGINTVFEHSLSENTDFSISIGHYKSEQIKGDGVVFDNLAGYERYDSTDNIISNPEYDIYGLFKEGQVYSNGEFFDSFYDDFMHQNSSYMQYKNQINFVASDMHNFSSGLTYKKYSLRYYRNLRPSLVGNEPREVNRYGFDSFGNESDDETYKNSTKHPTEFSFFLKDNITIDRLSVNAGVRIDRFDSDAFEIKNPERPFDPDGVNATDVTIDKEDLVKTKSKNYFNPHVVFNLKLIDQLQVFANWSQNHQVPSYGKMFIGFDFMEERIRSGFYYPFPSPSLEPVKVERIIFGYKAKLPKSFSLGVNVIKVEYKKQIGIYHQSPGFPYVYDLYGNNEKSKYSGLNFTMQYDDKKSFGWFFDATSSKTEGIGSYAGINQNIAWKYSQGTPMQSFPLDYNRSSKIVTGTQLRFSLSSRLSCIYKVQTGFPFTPLQVYDAVTNTSVQQVPTGPINSAYTKSAGVFDLNFEQDFIFTNYRITAFVIVKNLLDKNVITGVYEGTGSPTSTGYLETPEGIIRSQNATTGAEFTSRYQFAQNNPLNFYAPRQIIIGIKASF